MKFFMMQPWPKGQFIVEAGTVIDGNDPLYAGVAMPLTAKAMDQEALDALCVWHGEEQYRWLHYAPGLRLPRLGFPPSAQH
jgi:hypothetical protein